MSDQKKEHRRLHKSFIGKNISDITGIGWMLSEDQRDLLKKYGAWMEALVSGKIEAYTVQQKEFIARVKDKKEPFTIFDFTWRSVIEARKKRAENTENKIESMVIKSCNQCGKTYRNCLCSSGSTFPGRI